MSLLIETGIIQSNIKRLPLGAHGKHEPRERERTNSMTWVDLDGVMLSKVSHSEKEGHIFYNLAANAPTVTIQAVNKYKTNKTTK